MQNELSHDALRKKWRFALSFALFTCIALFVTSATAFANTNNNATAKINSIKTQTGFKPGSCGWTSWNNPRPSGWTNCSSGCWYFAANVASRMYGCWPSGTNGYTLKNPGEFNSVGQLVDTATSNPSYSGLQTLIKKAYPGDIIQFKGGPSGWGSYQHTAVVEAVDSNGVTIYQHADKAHVTSTYYKWNYFYNTYLDFDVTTSYNKGITLYHYKNYDKLFGSSVTPSVPTNVKLSNTLIAPSGSSVLSWNTASNAASYIIDGWCNGKEIMWKNVGTSTRITLSGLSEGTYSFFVIALNGDAKATSKGVSLQVSNITLTAPSNVALNKEEAVVGESVMLSWRSVGNANSYIIDGWRDGEEVLWKDVGGTTNYTISGLEEGKYSFFVIAKNGSVSSPSSKGVSVTVCNLEASTASLSNTAVLPGGVSRLTWTKVAGADKYIIDGWHNGEEIMWKDVTSLGSLDLSYNALGKYTFFVIATNSKGKSTSRAIDLSVVSSFSISGERIGLSKSTFTYNGRVQKPVVKTIGGKTLTAGIDYSVVYQNSSSKNVGTYKIAVTGKENYSGTTNAVYKITKASNSVRIAKASTKKTIKASKLKKKAQAIQLPKATAEFGMAKWEITKKDKMKVLSLKSGKVEVKKKAKKGSYTLKLKAYVTNSTNYKAATSKTLTVKVVVK